MTMTLEKLNEAISLVKDLKCSPEVRHVQVGSYLRFCKEMHKKGVIVHPEPGALFGLFSGVPVALNPFIPENQMVLVDTAGKITVVDLDEAGDEHEDGS